MKSRACVQQNDDSVRESKNSKNIDWCVLDYESVLWNYRGPSFSLILGIIF